MTFRGDRLGQHRLAAPRRADQQNALGRSYASLFKKVRIFQGPFHRFDQALLQGRHPSHVVPVDIGGFYKHLPNGRGFDLPQGGQKILHPHFELREGLVGNPGLGEIDIPHDLAQATHGRFPAEGLQIRPDEAVGDLRQMLHPDVFRQRHPPAVNLQDLHSAASVRDRNDDLPVEPARTP